MSANWKYWILLLPVFLLAGCGFHLRGEQPLAKDMRSMHLQTSSPYGVLTRHLKQSLKMSGVHLTDNPKDAAIILVILRDDTSQEFLGVSGTQQIRQYKLIANTSFQLTDNKGNVIIEPQTLSASRNITVQSNLILGSSNEATMYFKQMQRSLASSIMYRLSSVEISDRVNAFYHRNHAKSKQKISTRKQTQP